MPYIKPGKRPKFEKLLESMKELVTEEGDLNYVLFAFCKRYIPQHYYAFKNFVGELECCKMEVYRQLVAPYEDEKQQSNGDVV